MNIITVTHGNPGWSIGRRKPGLSSEISNACVIASCIFWSQATPCGFQLQRNQNIQLKNLRIGLIQTTVYAKDADATDFEVRMPFFAIRSHWFTRTPPGSVPLFLQSAKFIFKPLERVTAKEREKRPVTSVLIQILAEFCTVERERHSLYLHLGQWSSLWYKFSSTSSLQLIGTEAAASGLPRSPSNTNHAEHNKHDDDKVTG
jgi:hypothetical protein